MKKQLVHFIVKQLSLHPTPIERCDTVCAYSGEKIIEGIPLSKVIKPATANLADTFRFTSEHVSQETAACFAASQELRGNLFIDMSGIHVPMVSAKSAAEKGRKTWIEVWTEYLENPAEAVFIVTDESKRRLWIDATVTTDNPIQVFCNFDGKSWTEKLERERLKECIKVVQKCLQLGFSKKAIKTSLFNNREIYLKLGIRETYQLEHKLRSLRGTCESDFAINIGTVYQQQPVQTRTQLSLFEENCQ